MLRMYMYDRKGGKEECQNLPTLLPNSPKKWGSYPHPASPIAVWFLRQVTDAVGKAGNIGVMRETLTKVDSILGKLRCVTGHSRKLRTVLLP